MPSPPDDVWDGIEKKVRRPESVKGEV